MVRVYSSINCLLWLTSILALCCNVIGSTCHVTSNFKFLYGLQSVVMVSGGDGTPYRYLKSDFHAVALSSCSSVPAPACTAKSSYMRSASRYHAVHPKRTVLHIFWYHRSLPFCQPCNLCNRLMGRKNFSFLKRAQNPSSGPTVKRP